jgi:hypothetical protein
VVHANRGAIRKAAILVLLDEPHARVAGIADA